MREREFIPWPKIARLNRDILVTEKIDGTNACVVVTEDGEVYAQSRKRIISPTQDNHGFAKFVDEYKDELRDGLGPGHHFGEWYGSGIQRGYGLEKGDKRFALFNVVRWGDDATRGPRVHPSCDGKVTTVPLLGGAPDWNQGIIEHALDLLRRKGSFVPGGEGFAKPEGIVIYHRAANTSFKVTLEDDEKPKGQA